MINLLHSVFCDEGGGDDINGFALHILSLEGEYAAHLSMSCYKKLLVSEEFSSKYPQKLLK